MEAKIKVETTTNPWRLIHKPLLMDKVKNQFLSPKDLT